MDIYILFLFIYQVSHKLFWKRYFFRVHLIELQEARRQALKKRAEQIRIESDEGINWDDVGDLAPTTTAAAAAKVSSGAAEAGQKHISIDEILPHS